MEPRAGAPQERLAGDLRDRVGQRLAGIASHARGTWGTVLTEARLERPRTVVLVALAMVVAQLGFRAWALTGGWFLIDDYGFLSDVVGQKPTLGYLFQPHNDHLQPLGFLIVWLVGQSTPYNWGLTTAITMVLQALASLSAVVFLVRLVGARWCVLVPLGFYLFSVVTLPGFMWWCVAMLQVPQQLSAFAAMTCHTEYIRSGRSRWVWFTVLALALGMLSDVKVCFTGVALVFLSLYLSDARGLRGRLRATLRRQWWAWSVYGASFLGYLALYLHLNPLDGRGSGDPAGTFEVMLRHTLGPTIVGGPWQWGQMTDTPLVPAQSPEWAITVTWVVLTLLFVAAVRRRAATAWALAPFLVCVVVNVLMASTARGAIFGKLLGLEVRYLGDLAPTVTLTLAVLASGLAPTRERVTSPPSLRGHRLAPVVAGVLAGVALTGVVVSSLEYVGNWHAAYPARRFVQNVIRQSQSAPLTVVDKPVPLDVMPREEVVHAFERPSQIFRPLGGRVSTTREGTDVDVLDDTGVARPAVIAPQASSPPGPDRHCGYRVGPRTQRIPVAPVPGTPPQPEEWWASVSYLASADGAVLLGVDDHETEMEVRRGLHTYTFAGSGPVTGVRLAPLGDAVVCVDEVDVGMVTSFVGGQ